MIDIIDAPEGLDLSIQSTQNHKAGNILSTQLGSLEYLQDFGIDINFFLSEDFKFQNSSFQSYCVQALANQGINVATVGTVIQTFMTSYTFNLTPSESSTAMITR